MVFSSAVSNRESSTDITDYYSWCRDVSQTVIVTHLTDERYRLHPIGYNNALYQVPGRSQVGL